MDVSVIIVNYNTFAVTCDCLASLPEGLGALDAEVVLVDNASTERPATDFLERFPNLVLVQMASNEGFGRANNRGMERARGRYFILLNSDTLVRPGALERCCRYFDDLEDPAVGALGCQLLNLDGTPQRGHWPLPRPRSTASSFQRGLNHAPVLYRPWLRRHPAPYDGPPADGGPWYVGGLYGAFIMVRREVVDTVQGFDPDFFMYCEETEWFRNRISKRYRTVMFPDAQVVHLGGGSSSRVGSGFARRQTLLSNLLYSYKLGVGKFIGYVLGSWLSVVVNTITYPVLSPDSRSWFRAHVAVFPWYLPNILRFSRHWGSRPSPLALHRHG